jgi:hypothetical protein
LLETADTQVLFLRTTNVLPTANTVALCATCGAAGGDEECEIVTPNKPQKGKTSLQSV